MGVVDRSEWLRVLHKKLRQFARVGIGRVTGTTTHTDGHYKFMMDLEESRLFYRAELNAILKMLIDKKICSIEEWQQRMCEELELTLKEHAERWPEIKVDADGGSYTMDIQAMQARMRAEKWPP